MTVPRTARTSSRHATSEGVVTYERALDGSVEVWRRAGGRRVQVGSWRASRRPRVVLGLDRPSLAATSVERALAVARRAGADLVVVTGYRAPIGGFPHVVPDRERRAEAVRATATLADVIAPVVARERARPTGVEVTLQARADAELPGALAAAARPDHVQLLLAEGTRRGPLARRRQRQLRRRVTAQLGGPVAVLDAGRALEALA